MRYELVVTGPVDGFYTATVVRMGALVAREYRRDLARAKAAGMRVVAELADVTEVRVSEATRG